MGTEYASSSHSLNSMVSDEGDEELRAAIKSHQLPLRRRDKIEKRRDELALVENKRTRGAWLVSLATHPVIATLAGLMHLVGLHRVASMVASGRIGSFSETSSPEDSDHRRDGQSTATDAPSPWDYGFFVAITPPASAVNNNASSPGFMVPMQMQMAPTPPSPMPPSSPSITGF